MLKNLFLLTVIFFSCSCKKNIPNDKQLDNFHGSKTYYHADMQYLVIEGTRGMVVVNLTLDSLEKEIMEKKLEKCSR